MNFLSKLFKKIVLAILSFITLFCARTVQAQVTYASPEMMKSDVFNQFSGYMVIGLAILLFAIIGLITVIKFFINKLFKKNS